MTEIQLEQDVELVERDTLIPYTNNPKEHPDEQVKKIASSIKNYGWDQPIVVDENNEIIKGHGRVQAAELLDLTQVPVIQREDLTDAEKKASRIADNKTAESAWDIDTLGMEVEMLENEPIEIDSLGFDDDELDAFIDDVTSEPDARFEWEEAGMPDYENEDKTPDYTLKVNFRSAEDKVRFGELVESTVTEDTTAIWFPEQEKRDVKDTGWENES